MIIIFMHLHFFRKHPYRGPFRIGQKRKFSRIKKNCN